MGVWQDVKQCIDHWYFQWELASMLYVMDPGEKIAFHIVLIAVLALFIYGAITYWPPYVVMLLNEFEFSDFRTKTVQDDR